MKADLVKATGISRNVIERYAAGTSTPTLDYAETVAKYFGTTLAAILGAHSLEDCIDTVARISRKDDATLKRVLLKVYGPKQE